MDTKLTGPEVNPKLENLLGYLNFSSGATDAQFLIGLNQLYEHLDRVEPSSERTAPGRATPAPAWRHVARALAGKLDELRQSNSAFTNAEQADHVLRFIDQRLVKDYLEFHRDLLFHQSENDLLGPFMLGRFFEAALSCVELAEDGQRWSQRCIEQLNDFIGHRPVAVLESQKIEPRPHEWVRPVPLYIEQVGVAVGPYRELVERALELLRATDGDLKEAAYFHLDKFAELAFDPRAYDFDHPVNKRPNYHFGEWDPHLIDNQGYFRRFVVREVTLQALWERVLDTKLKITRQEAVFEAAAVLAGTILMASGISGYGPGTHDSHTTLMTLIPRIATFRDAFYERLIEQMEGAHGERLRNEAKQLRQPFGGARQHLNHFLALQRALQLQHAKLARVFARMGYLGAAQRQADTIQVAAARMTCRIDCAQTAARQSIQSHRREAAVLHLDRIVDLLHRGIDCGALADPWNILGFDANFSLFPALENSVRDRRLDDLIEIMHGVFELYSRLLGDAAAAHDQATAAVVESKFQAVATWWNQFAAHEVTSVHAESALREFEAACDVARALREWHLAGAASGDIAFWAPHVESFSSPRAYALVVETLLGRDDLVSSMSLLIHWLGQAPGVPLESNDSSFQDLATRWLRAALQTADAGKTATPNSWSLLRKFFDYMEANANEYWSVPKLQALDGRNSNATAAHDDIIHDQGVSTDDDAQEPEQGLFRAAYEDMVYRDSTDDGVEGSVFDTDPITHTELEQRSEWIADRLHFLAGVARLWTVSATSYGAAKADQARCFEQLTDVGESLKTWFQSARRIRQDLLKLIEAIQNEPIGHPQGDHDSMIEYDRKRLVKESMIEGAIATCVDVSEAERFLLAAATLAGETTALENAGADAIDRDLVNTAELLSAAMCHNKHAAAACCSNLMPKVADWQILYVPLAKSGNANDIALARIRQRIIENLLVVLPRLGLLAYAMRIIDAARRMERNLPVGRGVVTQFDELYKAGFREMVDALVRATTTQAGYLAQEDRDADTLLVNCLEQLTEPALESWLMHSRTLRLSVLERVRKPQAWKQLVEFIRHFGADLFTQRFLSLGNIRAILHCGPDNWLADMATQANAELKLISSLDVEIMHEEAADHLTLILEAIVENFDEYRDYNSTTTQSDRGEMLYTLLDFIRLRIEYDRVAWNLRPVVWAHEVLVRRGRNAAAQLWRRMLADRIGEEAARYQRRLIRLQRKYAMKMASVAQRIGERFLLPMATDRMLALVQPAVQQAEQGEASHAFDILEEECELLLREPTLTGAEIPIWLEALDEEAQRLHQSSDTQAWPSSEMLVQPLSCTMEELDHELQRISQRQRT